MSYFDYLSMTRQEDDPDTWLTWAVEVRGLSLAGDEQMVKTLYRKER